MLQNAKVAALVFLNIFKVKPFISYNLIGVTRIMLIVPLALSFPPPPPVSTDAQPPGGLAEKRVAEGVYSSDTRQVQQMTKTTIIR